MLHVRVASLNLIRSAVSSQCNPANDVFTCAELASQQLLWSQHSERIARGTTGMPGCLPTSRYHSPVSMSDTTSVCNTVGGSDRQMLQI